jgi:cobalt-zinc-cadmium resistance protein CzcA
VEGLPPGYFVEFGGQFENQQRAMQRLAIVVPVSILLIFLMLFSAFDSARSALLVLLNLPFALIGGILAIFLANVNLSVSSVVGFIALFGIAVENGTLLVAFFNRLRDQGMDAVEAVKRGCELRFRPLLMTGLTTLLGLTPLLFAGGSGLVSSMLLTLIVLPVLYSIVESRR